MIKIKGIVPIHELENGTIACLYCEYLHGEVRCARMCRTSGGRTKITINDPFSINCGNFSPAFRCDEDNIFLKLSKLDEAYGGGTEEIICSKGYVDGVEVTLCEYYPPKDDVEKTLKENTFEKFGIEFEVEK